MRLPRLALCTALALSTAACGVGNQSGPKVPTGPEGAVDAAPVSDAQFAGAAYQVLLSDERTPQRMGLLAGVVRRQLARAAARFGGEKREAGLSALTGALYLMRTGDLRPEMLVGGAPALRAGATEVSRVGNEGRALALYGMLQTVLPRGNERADVDAHLDALKSWSAALKSASQMQSSGSYQRTTTDRAMFEPTPKAMGSARDATITWIHRALELNTSEAAQTGNFERDEAIEAYRALRAGGATLVAIYLRYGDAKAALAALEKGDLVRVTPPGLVERLEHAAEDDDPSAWSDLYRLYSSSEDANRPETSMDPTLAKAAAFGCAVELFRAEPRSLRGAGPLAVELVDQGMAEVAPAVLTPALGNSPSAQDLSWTLSLTLRALLGEAEIGEHAAARRTFKAAEGMLTLADAQKLVGKVRPTPARLRYVMGVLETRAGDLGRARPLIAAAVQVEQTPEGLNMLAAIDRQRGDAKAALASLDRVASLARKSGDATAEAEAQILVFEINRDQGNVAEAKSALDAALKSALKARESSRSGSDQARSERVLARVLEHFGATQSAKRATDRAYEASRADTRQLTATVLDASRRALTSGDLLTARQALRQALDAGLAEEDLIYAALWLSLLERSTNATSDGSTEEAFASIDDSGGWPAKLASWGRGKLTDEQLTKTARTRVQKTEAKFYAAMRRRAKGVGEIKKELTEVASSETIELVEVTIARDLLAREAPLPMKLPDGVAVP
jgi:tetratricopeptide (TPR) repeat protein